MENQSFAGLAGCPDRTRESADLDELSLSSIPSHLRGRLENSRPARAPRPVFTAEDEDRGRLSRLIRTSGYLSTSGQDDKEQKEALRTIQELRINREDAAHAGHRLSAAEQDLEVERSLRKRAEAELMRTKTQLRQAQEQVLCMEHELDGKENVLQATEQRLEAFEQSLREAQGEISRLRSLQQPAQLTGIPRLRLHELALMQKHLEPKEQEMARLVAAMTMLPQFNRYGKEDDAATSYGSDLSSARVSSHGSYL